MAVFRISSIFSKLFKPVNAARSISTGANNLSSERGENKSEKLGFPREPNTTGIFTEEHYQLKQSLRKLIDTEINPYVDEWEAAGDYPAHEVFKKLGDAGFLGVTKPPKFGGLGLDWTYALAVHEELGHINCGAIPMSVGVQTDMATPALAAHGSDELRELFLAPSIAGDLIGCIGVSEASAGSDVAAIKTTAVRKGDDYIINGSKMWITNGIQGDWICLLTNTGEGPTHKNKTLIVVPLDTPGVVRARRISKMGMHCSDTAELFFEDVRVPVKYAIGKENLGFMYQMQQFQLERLFAASSLLTPLDGLIRETIEYCSQRKAFGAPLIDNQVIHFRLAELQTDVEALRALIYRAVGIYINGEDATYLASMCKLKAGRLARELTDSCLQYWGGMGFTNEVKISRFYRDFRLVSIGGGADEVMLSIICKYMGTLPEVGKGL